MNYHSILFKKPNEANLHEFHSEAPSFFLDFNLDQIINSITADKAEYNLKPLFYTVLHDNDEIQYRHEIMHDLENLKLVSYIKIFSKGMHQMREYLDHFRKLYYHYQKERLFLDAVTAYCESVIAFVDHLYSVTINSKGLINFREYLSDYVKSIGFITLYSETQKIRNELSTVRYSILINDGAITIGKDESDVNYSHTIEKIFSKFKQDDSAKNYKKEISNPLKMNHIEARILDIVAKLYPETFKNLNDYVERNDDFIDSKISDFDREIQFYISYIDYIARVKKLKLNFCYPEISNNKSDIYLHDGFDLALAASLIHKNSPVVCNSFNLSGDERIIVVTGPNQGGKTTFARMFGQLHYLAILGLPIPGTEAKLFQFDRIFSHFEKEESITTLRGKLEDDLVRVNEILTQASADSIIIMNEIYTSTTLQDAIYLSKRTIEIISDLDALCVWVTFIDEVASFNNKTVSMVSMVSPKDVAIRTYKIIRRPADGFSYALTIARKYRLTYDCIMGRIKL
jgi:DNA mismatch repair protein MutS